MVRAPRIPYDTRSKVPIDLKTCARQIRSRESNFTRLIGQFRMSPAVIRVWPRTSGCGIPAAARAASLMLVVPCGLRIAAEMKGVFGWSVLQNLSRRIRVPSLAGALLLVAGVVASAAFGRAPATVCSPGQLRAVYVNSTRAMGTIAGEYGFENVTARRCGLRGYPRVQMLTRSGSVLATRYEHEAPGAFGIGSTKVVLAGHGIAYFAIVYASETGFGRLRCPTSAALKLTPPGLSVGLVLTGKGGQITPYGGSTVHLECGTVRVSLVAAKRFQ